MFVYSHSDDSINDNLTEESKAEMEYVWKLKAERIHLNYVPMNKWSGENRGWDQLLYMMQIVCIERKRERELKSVLSLLNKRKLLLLV